MRQYAAAACLHSLHLVVHGRVYKEVGPLSCACVLMLAHDPRLLLFFAVQEDLQSNQQAGRDAQKAMDAINKELMQTEARISKLAAAELSARQAAEAEEEQVRAARLSCQPSVWQGEQTRALSQQN